MYNIKVIRMMGETVLKAIKNSINFNIKTIGQMGKKILYGIMRGISFYFTVPTITRIIYKKDRDSHTNSYCRAQYLPSIMLGFLFFGIICSFTIPIFKTFFNFFTISWLITNFLSFLYEWHRYEKNKLISKINSNADLNIELDESGKLLAISSSVTTEGLAPSFDGSNALSMPPEDYRWTSSSDQLDDVMQDLKTKLDKDDKFSIKKLNRSEKKLNRSDLIDLD